MLVRLAAEKAWAYGQGVQSPSIRAELSRAAKVATEAKYRIWAVSLTRIGRTAPGGAGAFW